MLFMVAELPEAPLLVPELAVGVSAAPGPLPAPLGVTCRVPVWTPAA